MLKQIYKTVVVYILETEARMVLRKYRPKIIAITGTVGKTSTKDAIFAVIGESLLARKSEKSFNSEIGLPLTILNCENGWLDPLVWIKNIIKGFLLFATRVHYPKWLVLEIGAGKPGDIDRAVSIVTPDVVVITRFSEVPVHVEFYKSPEEVFEEKTKLVTALRPTGVLIVNADDDRVYALRKKTTAISISYGLSSHATFRATNVKIAYQHGVPVGTTFKLEFEGNVFPVVLKGVAGVQAVYSALAAIATGSYLNLNVIDLIQRLSGYLPPSGRMRVLAGIKNTTIIDDTYNASPVASEAAVEALRIIKTSGRKIAALGDMLELGKFTADEHKKLGKMIGSFADLLFVVGPRSKYIVEGALEADMSEKNIVEFDDSRTLGKHLDETIKEGDVILIKGSQGMRMERAVLEIMAEPDRASELLVRQEDAWELR